MGAICFAYLILDMFPVGVSCRLKILFLSSVVINNTSSTALCLGDDT